MSTVTSPVLRGPVRVGERTLAPDLARGLMLLLIALANVPWYLYGTPPGSASVHPAEGTVADRIVQGVMIIAVDLRVYPMFAFLFGYGMVQLFRRQIAAGTSERAARRILRRRNLWLIVFGVVDAALFWMGDVLGAYGLAGLIVVALFFRRRDTTLLVWAAIGTVVLGLLMVLAIVGSVIVAPDPTLGGSFNLYAEARGGMANDSFLGGIPERVSTWVFLSFFQGVIGLVVPIVLLLAFWAARRQVLERPADHLLLLRRVAVGGIAVGWLGSIPLLLHHLGVLGVPDHVSWVFTAIQPLTGMFGGLGYVAVFGLVGHALADRTGDTQPGPVRAITAVGRRSLSCYLAQSVLCAPLLCAWGLGLGGVLGSTGAALFAIAVWLVTVALAWLLERQGRRGPAEVALRFLAYGGSASAR